MKRTLLSLLLMAAAVNANATLVGDTVTASHLFPTTSSTIGSSSTTVTNGTGDIMRPYYYYTVNVEADRVLINEPSNPGWNTALSFNGLFIDSLNDSTGKPLIGITVDTNISNWSNARLTFDADSIWVNLGLGSSLGAGYLNLILDFGNRNSVPEPSALALAMLGFAGLGFQQRKKNKAA